ncbi:hypothetical protein RB195_014254 [Necator americanus]|uniref:Uncharacterized protein n=1 Tax=Necator americanus TaxID=51031 RepID=A0ABR1DZ95_NECAM
MNNDSFEQLNTLIGRLRMRRCGSTLAWAYPRFPAPTSSYKEGEAEASYMGPKKFYREATVLQSTISSAWSLLAVLTPRLAPEERLKNFTEGPTASNLTSQKDPKRGEAL